MRMFRAVGYPANRAAGRWVSDVLVTVAAAAGAVPALVHGNVQPRGLASLVVALTAAPLLVRRAWPVPVFGCVLAAAIGAGLWNRSAIDGPALLVALYTVASMRPRREALACAGVLELATLIGLILFAGSGWWYDAIFVAGMIAAALGLGLYSATRRAYLAELHDRAERLERERDQQGALAAAAERARIAREMHDIVAHHLTVMVALSDGAIAASATSPERAAEVMRSVSASGRRALADTRRLLGVLRPGTGDDPGQFQPLPGLAELDVLIDQVRAAGLATTLEVHGAASELPAGVQLTVYRLVQEALTNTLKHGGRGASAVVRLQYLPGGLQVDIEDDGAGTRASTPANVGSGLVGMRERAHAYGGDVQSGPRQPGGWRVSARLHLDEGDA
jgi:signal transduction histidine kinase